MTTTTNTFADLGLADTLLRAIVETGYTTPTPIQAQAIPLVLQGGDLMAAAQTGTGKTAGFTLPILQILAQNKPAAVESPHASPNGSRPGGRRAGRPRCLILTPTRELTAQVAESVQTYGKYTGLASMVMFGGVNINPQISALKKPLDILVATPGRLLDHAGQKTVDLSGVEILVLDEADRMLDMGFIHDIRRVLRLLPATRQNLLFSATFSEEIRQLARGILHNPGEVSVTPRNTTTESVAQSVHLVQQSHKRDMVSHLIRASGWHQVLVFTRTKHGANRLAEKLLKDGLTAAAIHGNKSQSARTRALSGFKDGSVAVLVATDIAARGLDIDQLPLVLNFELPNVPEDYVHRIGRTGRAGATGSAISLVDDSEIKLLKAIERLINKPIARQPLPAGWTAPVRSAAEERAELEDERDDEGPRGGGRGMRGEPRRGQGQDPRAGGRNGGNTANRGAGGNGNHRGAKPAQPNGHGRAAAQPQGDRREHGQAGQPARRPESARPRQAGNQPRRDGAPRGSVLLGK